MPTISDLTAQTESLQAKAQEQLQLAEEERKKAEEARDNDDPVAMQDHLKNVDRYDAAALAYQSQIKEADIRIKQQQKLVNDLTEKRNRMIETHEQEIHRIDLEIQQASGE